MLSVVGVSCSVPTAPGVPADLCASCSVPTAPGVPADLCASCSVPTAPGVPADLCVLGRLLFPGTGVATLLGPGTGVAALLGPGTDVAALLGPGTGVAALPFWLDDVFRSPAESSTDKIICTKIFYEEQHFPEA